MFLVFAIVWQIFGSAEVQEWDSYWENEKYMHLRNIEDCNDSDEETIEKD